MVFVRRNKCICGLAEVKSANHKKDWVRKSQGREVSHLRNFRKSSKLFKSANLRICDLLKFFADRPPLLFCTSSWKLFCSSNSFGFSEFSSLLVPTSFDKILARTKTFSCGLLKETAARDFALFILL
jgi:hypothetical protein